LDGLDFEAIFVLMQGQLNDSRTIRAWTMYDWSISVYNLVIGTTFFPIYFLAVTKSVYGEDSVPLFGLTFKNSALYNYTLSFAYLLIALLLPILSSIADSAGNKKSFMKYFCYQGGLACMGMFWFNGENVWWGVLCLSLAAMGYVGSLVFYNSYLPEICTEDQMDRVSAKGFAMGYIGSVTLQLIGFGLVIYFTGKGDKTSGPLYTFVLTGLWWIGFAQIPFAFLKDRKIHNTKHRNFISRGFKELRKVWHQIRKLSTLKWFLSAFFFYSMGVQTIMLAATIFGSRMLRLPNDKLIITVVIIQLVAILGATLMARLSGKFGNLNVLTGVVVIWIAICVAAFEIANVKEAGVNVEYHFYGLAACVGLVMGGIQSLSRSTYSKLMPETNDTASFFSFYDVTEKIAIVIGIFSFGVIDEIFGMKNSVLSLIVFFFMGLVSLIITRQKQRQISIAVPTTINNADA
jgi:MFS transporter, UMF1 family